MNAACVWMGVFAHQCSVGAFLMSMQAITMVGAGIIQTEALEPIVYDWTCVLDSIWVSADLCTCRPEP